MSLNAPEIFRGKHIAILGAGYVGGAVARRLVGWGASVTALTRNADQARSLTEAGVRVIQADLADDGWHGELAGGVDWGLNTVSAGGCGVAGYRRSYVEGMQSVRRWLEGLAQTGGVVPGAFVYTGSTSVYPQNGGDRVDETAETGKGGENVECLLEAERLVLGWAGCGVVLRLAGIYGPGRHFLLDQLREGGGPIAGRGDYHLNLIHRDDIVAGVIAAWVAAARGAVEGGGVFNLADDGAATKGEMVAWLAERLEVPRPEFSGEPAGGRRRITPDRIVDNAKAKQVLRWSPRYPTFREGYGALLEG